MSAANQPSTYTWVNYRDKSVQTDPAITIGQAGRQTTSTSSDQSVGYYNHDHVYSPHNTSSNQAGLMDQPNQTTFPEEYTESYDSAWSEQVYQTEYQSEEYDVPPGRYLSENRHVTKQSTVYGPNDYYEISDGSVRPGYSKPINMRIGIMYQGSDEAHLNIIPVKIHSDDTYEMLVQYILTFLNTTSDDFHGYIMTTEGLIDLTSCVREVVQDFSLIDHMAEIKDNLYHLLILLVSPQKMHNNPVKVLTNPGKYKDLKSNRLVALGGPYAGQPERWIDITDQLEVKVAIVPCEKCTSGNNCYKGLRYSEHIFTFDIMVNASTTYQDVYHNLMASMMNTQRSYNFIDRYRQGIPSAKQIQNSHLYLYTGEYYINISMGQRMVFQDYHLWKRWAQVSKTSEYGLYLHMCPSGLDSNPMSYEQNILTLGTWWGGIRAEYYDQPEFITPELKPEYVPGKSIH